MKIVEPAYAAYSRSYNLLPHKPHKREHETPEEKHRSRNDTPEMVNDRIRKSLGLIPEEKTDEKNSPEVALEYEKEHFYLGKYVNIVV